MFFLSLFFSAYDCTLHYLECCPLYIYSPHSPNFPHSPIRCSFQTVPYSLMSTFTCHSFVTTVNILSQICDNFVTAARQQNWTYHFLKNLHLFKRRHISNKTQYNHYFCKFCSHPHGRIHAHTKEPPYSEFAIVTGHPSQLDLCTNTLPFILLLGQFKQMNLLANRHV